MPRARKKQSYEEAIPPERVTIVRFKDPERYQQFIEALANLLIDLAVSDGTIDLANLAGMPAAAA